MGGWVGGWLFEWLSVEVDGWVGLCVCVCVCVCNSRFHSINDIKNVEYKIIVSFENSYNLYFEII